MGWSRFLRRKYWDEVRAREIETYLEIETEENMHRGMPLEQARQAAHCKLGNPTLIREEIYHMNSVRVFESLYQDMRHTLRTLAKSPAFTIAVLATLSLCIGANTAIYTVVDALFFKPLPYPDPSRLVLLSTVFSKGGAFDVDTSQDGFQWELVRDHASLLD
ncbi:MAG: permease prefix domain 1-containing protein, partial [Acidobacteriota bacterium]|nr:permease prefix domain 1-containing protein [Acidobacteriota bacterium]